MSTRAMGTILATITRPATVSGGPASSVQGSAEGLIELGFGLCGAQCGGPHAQHDHEIGRAGDAAIFAEPFANAAFAAVASDRVADALRRHDAQPARPRVLARREQQHEMTAP